MQEIERSAVSENFTSSLVKENSFVVCYKYVHAVVHVCQLDLKKNTITITKHHMSIAPSVLTMILNYRKQGEGPSTSFGLHIP